MVKPVLGAHVKAKINEVVSLRARNVGPEDSFFVIDLAALETQFKLWKEHLSIVVPHYAVKCNNHPSLISKFIQWGAGFDCASRNEIDQVIKLGAQPTKIVYANPVKAPSHLKFAADIGVKRTTFDNVAELHKIQRYAPNCEALLRLKTDDDDAVCSLSCKFGAALHQTEYLLAEAAKLGVNVTGVAYHVGSGGGTAPDAHAKALKDARSVFDIAATKFGLSFKVLDVGGGFGATPDEFIPAAKQINESLQSLQFPSGIEIIGEPGRFFAAPTCTLVANVIGVRKAGADSDEIDMAYLSDGLYGNLNSILYDHQEAKPYLFGDWDEESSKPDQASLWGPTCDGLDNITSAANFPRPLQVGDWVYFVDAGAYTLVGESTFNGFNTDTQAYVVE